MKRIYFLFLLIICVSMTPDTPADQLRVYDAHNGFKGFDSTATIYKLFVQQFDSLCRDTMPRGYAVILRPVATDKKNVGAFEAGFIRRSMINNAPAYFFTGGKYAVLTNGVDQLSIFNPAVGADNDQTVTNFFSANPGIPKRARAKIRSAFLEGNKLYADY